MYKNSGVCKHLSITKSVQDSLGISSAVGESYYDCKLKNEGSLGDSPLCTYIHESKDCTECRTYESK